MKKTKLACLILLAGAAFGMGWLYQLNVLAQGFRKPRLVQYIVEEPGKIGENGRLKVQLTEAIRSDGSTMLETLQLAGNAGHRGVREIINPKSGTSAVLDPETKLVLRAQLNARQIEQHSGPIPARCEDAFSAPGTTVTCQFTSERILDRPTMKVVQIMQTGNPELRREILAAPDLQWLPLKINVFSGGSLVEVRTAVVLQEGEPNGELFVIPSDYVAVDQPSQIIQRSFESRGQSYDKQHLRRIDDAFRTRKDAAASGR